MYISIPKEYIRSDALAAMILVESAMNPQFTAEELKREVLNTIRLELRVNGFTGLDKRVEQIKAYTFINKANLKTCYKVATKLIKWDATGSIDRLLQPKPSTEAYATM